MDHHDVIVIGIGGMGSAALFHTARRGARVLGLEQYEVPHELGSSHGETRIIRLAYWEDPAYVPLVRRAYELWRQLEQLAGERLLFTTGSIDAGAAESRPVRGALEACRRFDLPYEILESREVQRRFPGYRLPENLVAIFQPDGGFLLSERCIAAHVKAAIDAGAELHTHERVARWEVRADHRADHVEVHTDRATYTAHRLIVTAGPWAGKLARAVQPLVQVERQAVMWTRPLRADLFVPEKFPVAYLHDDDGSYYGLPIFSDRGFKIGRYHHLRQIVDPDNMDRNCHAADEAVLRQAVDRYFPDAAGPAVQLKTCLFTNTSDEHFIIDVLPEASGVSIAAGFSGHGYKFCSVVGEILADLALEGGTRHDISLFSLGGPARE